MLANDVLSIYKKMKHQSVNVLNFVTFQLFILKDETLVCKIYAIPNLEKSLAHTRGTSVNSFLLLVISKRIEFCYPYTHTGIQAHVPTHYRLLLIRTPTMHRLANETSP